MSPPHHVHPINKDKPLAICWLRRDLRLHDHHALYAALKEHKHVLPLFIFDRDILDKLPSKEDARVHFIHTTLLHLQAQLQAVGSTLCVLHGNPLSLFKTLARTYTLTGGEVDVDEDGATTTVATPDAEIRGCFRAFVEVAP